MRTYLLSLAVLLLAAGERSRANGQPSLTGIEAICCSLLIRRSTLSITQKLTSNLLALAQMPSLTSFG